MFNNRRYVIIFANELNNVNINDILEGNFKNLRYDIFGVKCIIKYDGSMPQSIKKLSYVSKEYTHQEIKKILKGDEWYVGYTESPENDELDYGWEDQ